jgi:hypothetical protein
MNEDDYYWSLEEKQLLTKCYTTCPFEELIYLFGRSREAIIGAANSMGLTRRLWSKEDEEWLIKNYNTHTRKECADFLGKTEASINRKCRTLKLYKEPITWTKEEDCWLTANYPTYDLDECAEQLNRSYSAVIARLRKLNIRLAEKTSYTKQHTNKSNRYSWTCESEQWLLDNFAELGIHGCAEHFKLSDSAVYHKYFRLTHNK